MKKLMLKMIRFYQTKISPNTPPRCKYYPTCSQYALEAIETFGAFKGFFLALWRLLRCNPFSKGGIDPVPEKKVKIKKG
ncbi:MAG: membrane protein insertion efficiency factor YidD [Ruminococcus sp.]|nr:membrane protein insertion efficiency factor YidD [Oscillospiraceae bacterium]